MLVKGFDSIHKYFAYKKNNQNRDPIFEDFMGNQINSDPSTNDEDDNSQVLLINQHRYTRHPQSISTHKRSYQPHKNKRSSQNDSSNQSSYRNNHNNSYRRSTHSSQNTAYS